jgi:membrane protease YdiL (CAAX protease family)
MMPWLDVGALTVLLVVLPVLAVAQIRMLGDTEIERMPAYVSSVGTLVLLAIAAWLVGNREGATGLGLDRLPVASLFGWSVALTLGGLGILMAFKRIAAKLRMREHPVLRALLPRSPREKVVFAGLSLAAGVGEELAYRGYAIGALAPLIGAPVAAVVTSAVFGVLHAYQGPLGIVRAGVLGGLMAWGFLVSGSLWPVIIAHASLDVVAGIFLADRLMVPGDSGGVSANEPARDGI